MNARALLAAILLALSSAIALAQGFAGLGTTADDGFAVPDPGYRFSFPEDHGPHPEYRIEWWYVTANLTGLDGAEYGIQWTLFRSALAPGEAEGWDSPQIWMGHAAASTATDHFVAERLARGGIGQAGVTARPFRAWIDNWEMAGDTLEDVTLHAQGAAFSYDLNLTTDRPFVPQGAQGYSVKSRDGQASHYYSQPFYEVTGTLSLPDGPVEVTGTAWLDREWSSQPLSDSQTGWDWFSFVLDDGARLMGFRLRDRDGPPFTSGTWIAADGTPSPLAPGAFRATPLEHSRVAGRDIPTSWRVELAERGLDVTVHALNPQSWMDTTFAYWEGPVRLSGSHAGRGYLEMTGYE